MIDTLVQVLFSGGNLLRTDSPSSNSRPNQLVDPPPSRDLSFYRPDSIPEVDNLAVRMGQAEEDMGLVQQDKDLVAGCSSPFEGLVGNSLVGPVDRDLGCNHHTQAEEDAGARRTREDRQVCCKPF